MATSSITRRRALSPVATTLTAALVVALLGGCSFPEPDEAEVVRVISELPGVTAVDASYDPPSLGHSSDGSLGVTVATSPDPNQMEDLVQRLQSQLAKVPDADGYRSFTLSAPGVDPRTSAPAPSTFTFLRGPVPPGLAKDWATALASSPPSAIGVRAPSKDQPAAASLSAPVSVSSSLAWVLASSLRTLPWTVGQLSAEDRPYVRFAPGSPVSAQMVQDWKGIEAKFGEVPGRYDAEPMVRFVIVENVEQVRRVRIIFQRPDVDGSLLEATHGQRVWPLVDAIHAATPGGAVLDLDLIRSEGEEPGPTPKTDLIDGGKGAADWEAAYRQRFPDAVTPTATPK
ncbi:hypothetical protein V6K52_02930 [Knoellia sp. S7-12]|uniref:hypothetical protein n=1 Tax=Knoellia sp. S7-12 TaxID=3126698 RepID=UPI0033696F19